MGVDQESFELAVGVHSFGRVGLDGFWLLFVMDYSAPHSIGFIFHCSFFCDPFATIQGGVTFKIVQTSRGSNMKQPAGSLLSKQGESNIKRIN